MQAFQVFLDATRGPPCEEMQQHDPEIFCFLVIGKQFTYDVAGFWLCLTLWRYQQFYKCHSLNENWLHNAFISAK